MRRYRKHAMSLIENVYKTRKNDKISTILEHGYLNFFFLIVKSYVIYCVITSYIIKLKILGFSKCSDVVYIFVNKMCGK